MTTVEETPAVAEEVNPYLSTPSGRRRPTKVVERDDRVLGLISTGQYTTLDGHESPVVVGISLNDIRRLSGEQTVDVANGDDVETKPMGIMYDREIYQSIHRLAAQGRVQRLSNARQSRWKIAGIDHVEVVRPRYVPKAQRVQAEVPAEVPTSEVVE